MTRLDLLFDVLGWTGIGSFSIIKHQDCGINIQVVIIMCCISFIISISMTLFIIHYLIHRLAISKFSLYDPKISFALYFGTFNVMFGILTGIYVIYPDCYEYTVLGNSIWYTIVSSCGWPFYIAGAVQYSKNYLQFLKGIYSIMTSESKKLIDDHINNLNLDAFLYIYIVIFFIPSFGLAVEEKYYYIFGIMYYNALGTYIFLLFIFIAFPMMNLVDQQFTQYLSHPVSKIYIL